MDYKKLIKLEEHETMEGLMEEGISINYSKNVDSFFINNIKSEPMDSYGCEWKTKQSCMILRPNELDMLIEELQKMRDFRNNIK